MMKACFFEHAREYKGFWQDGKYCLEFPILCSHIEANFLSLICYSGIQKSRIIGKTFIFLNIVK